MADSPITNEGDKQIIINMHEEREKIIRTESNDLDVSGRERERERVSGRERESVSGRQRESVSGRQRQSLSGSEEEQIDEQRMLEGLESSYEANKVKLVTDIKDFIKKEDNTIDDIDISIKADEESQVDKLERCSSQQSPQQSLASLQSVPAYSEPVTIREDITLDPDCLNMIDDIYLDCQENLKKFFDSSNIGRINTGLKTKIINTNKFLQIEINTGAPGKFLLEINICTSDSAGNIIKLFECVHFSLFTRFENGALTIRGLHFTLPHNIINRSNKRYSHLYIGHKFAENCLCKIYAANTFIITILKSIGTYFDKQMSISNPAEPAKPSVINFIRLLRLTSGERKAIGQLLIDLGEKYKVYFEALVPASGPASGAACVAASGAASGAASVPANGAASGAASVPANGGGMKIMKYNKVVEKSNSKDGKNTLVNNKELKINKIKDKIKILKQDKIKNKDKIIKQIKLIEDIKTKIKIEKERARQKHKEKASIIKRKASVSKTPTTKPKTPKTPTAKPKTPTAKPKTPKTTTAKPKTTTAKPKTPKTTTTAKPKTTTAKPKTPKTTTTKPKTTKTTTAKPRTPKTPKTTTAKPKTTKRQANK